MTEKTTKERRVLRRQLRQELGKHSIALAKLKVLFNSASMGRKAEICDLIAARHRRIANIYTTYSELL